jgi:hypothetical protein
MSRIHGHFLCLSGLILLALLPLAAHAEAGARWVHGSWVNVRKSVEAQSVVIDHVTTNTPVEVVAQHDRICEIVWGESKRGFVACGLLGKRALTLAETDNYPGSAFNPLRTFWISPSIFALFRAGRHFWQTLLTEEQRELESEESAGREYGNHFPVVIRYPVPEFEAMKALLAKGIVAGADREQPLVSCRQMHEFLQERIKKFGGPAEWWWNRWGEGVYMPDGRLALMNDCRGSSLLKLELPEIRPSFFRDDKNILPGNTNVERISAHFGIVEYGKVTCKPHWVMPYKYHEISGYWDIGCYEWKLDKPVFEHVIGRDGQVGVYQWLPKESFGTDDYQQQRRGETLQPAYPAIEKEEALFLFHASKALPFKKAQVFQQTISKHIDVVNNIQIDISEVDLDGDKIVDFVHWFDRSATVHVTFININGEWFPFEKKEPIEDGC